MWWPSTLLYCVPGHKKLILATVSELPRLDIGYLAVNTLASVLTMKHVWEAAGGHCKVLHPWSMEQRCTLLSRRVLHWSLLH